MKDKLIDITKKSGLVFSGKIIRVILTTFLTFLAARYLGAELYGKFRYVYTFIDFIPMLLLLGFHEGIIYFLPKLKLKKQNELKKSLISFSLFIPFVLSLIVLFIVIYNSEFIAETILNNSDLSSLVKFLAPLLVFLVLVRIFEGVFRGLNQVKYSIYAKEIIIPFLKVIFLIFLVFLGYELFGIVISYYISIILGLIYLFKVTLNKKLLGKINFKYISNYYKLLRFSLPLFLTGILNFFLKKTDVFMVGYFLTDSNVGIYEIALKVGTMSSFVLVSFNTIFAPVISSLYEDNDLKQLAIIYKNTTKWIVGCNLVFISLILMFSDNIMRIFGSNFTVGSISLILISIGQLVNSSVGSAGYINIMTGHPEYELYNNIITVVINVLLNYFLIPIYGIEGAAFASLVSVSIANIIKLILVYKTHEIHPYNKDYVFMIVAIVISNIIVLLLNSLFSLSWFFELFILSSLFVLVFGVIYYLIAFSEGDEIILNAIKKKFQT